MQPQAASSKAKRCSYRQTNTVLLCCFQLSYYWLQQDLAHAKLTVDTRGERIKEIRQLTADRLTKMAFKCAQRAKCSFLNQQPSLYFLKLRFCWHIHISLSKGVERWNRPYGRPKAEDLLLEVQIHNHLFRLAAPPPVSCARCKKSPIADALRAPCGHICCFSCWRIIIEEVRFYTSATCSNHLNFFSSFVCLCIFDKVYRHLAF